MNPENRRADEYDPLKLALLLRNEANGTTAPGAESSAAGDGWGMGRKPPDTEGVFACWRCHDLMDGRQRDPAISRDDIKEAVAKGHERTLAIWREMGVL